MAISKEQVIQNLLTELKSVTSENQSLKSLKNSLQNKEVPKNSENPNDSFKESIKALLSKFIISQESLLNNKLSDLKSQIETKNSYLQFLEKVKSKLTNLQSIKQKLSNDLSSLKSASSKYRQLISKLLLKHHLQCYKASTLSAIDLKCEEMSQKGIDVSKILKKIKKIFRLNELNTKISNLESELSRLNKKKQKLENSSDSSIEELQDDYFK